MKELRRQAKAIFLGFIFLIGSTADATTLYKLSQNIADSSCEGIKKIIYCPDGQFIAYQVGDTKIVSRRVINHSVTDEVYEYQLSSYYKSANNQSYQTYNYQLGLIDFTSRNQDILVKDKSQFHLVGRDNSGYVNHLPKGMISTRKDTLYFNGHKVKLPDDKVDLATLSDSGRYFAGTVDNGKTVKVWKTTDQSIIKSITLDSGSYLGVSFPQGKEVVVFNSSDNLVKVEPLTDEVVLPDECHQFSYAGSFLFVSPGADWIFICNNNRKRISIFSMQSKELLSVIETKDEINAAALSPDGEHLILGMNNGSLESYTLIA